MCLGSARLISECVFRANRFLTRYKNMFALKIALIFPKTIIVCIILHYRISSIFTVVCYSMVYYYSIFIVGFYYSIVVVVCFSIIVYYSILTVVCFSIMEF